MVAMIAIPFYPSPPLFPPLLPPTPLTLPPHSSPSPHTPHPPSSPILQSICLIPPSPSKISMEICFQTRQEGSRLSQQTSGARATQESQSIKCFFGSKLLYIPDEKELCGMKFHVCLQRHSNKPLLHIK